MSSRSTSGRSSSRAGTSYATSKADWNSESSRSGSRSRSRSPPPRSQSRSRSPSPNRSRSRSPVEAASSTLPYESQAERFNEALKSDISPHLQGYFGLPEEILEYVRASPHAILYMTRNGVRTEFPVNVDVLTSKYSTFESMFDPELAFMTKTAEADKYFAESAAKYDRRLEKINRRLVEEFGVTFDEEGAIASNGTIGNQEVFDRLRDMRTRPRPVAPLYFVDLDRLCPDTIITDVEAKFAAVDPKQPTVILKVPKLISRSNSEENTETKRSSKFETTDKEVPNFLRRPTPSTVFQIAIDLAYWSTLYARRNAEIKAELNPRIITAYEQIFGQPKQNMVPEFKVPIQFVYECMELASILG